MSKYDPLTRVLERAARASVPMSFAEVERILGFELPRSARTYRPWWSNDAGSHTQARSWLSAGYRASEVSLEGEEVVFLRDASGAGKARPSATTPGMHPVFGCMAGTVTIPEGTDLTEPAMPEWAEMIETAKLYNE
ncbi:DUF7662 domain-containing protein [Vannielia litorea]|uniref:DUF7662 domain-containing protein n=1 Tax=Vannielia litorea TaxID=1217970 RepID=A0A1N6GB82_9RHOB|nr:hypothetical protein [Vannielia litorea]SIO04783.1 hypothetical protein SAMN05444002_2349 [Vannielia litorea]